MFITRIRRAAAIANLWNLSEVKPDFEEQGEVPSAGSTDVDADKTKKTSR